MDRSDQPAAGAVKSALTGVLADARACVAGESGPTHVRVTWSSSGAMKSVDIQGPAQSDPHAKLCLNRTFAHAHLPAFGAPTYSAGLTIRP
jgi:hypothetical protein